jgi:hypothetical protein
MIEVQVGADISEAINALKRAEKGIKDFGREANRTNAALNQTRTASNAANTSLINIGRIFQDLPYGIIGVANNINPLIEGLSRTSAAAKEAGVSLGSTLLNSLKGAGGLAFAFSIVTAAAQFATLGFSAFFRNISGGKKDIEEFKKELEGATNALTNAIKEIDKLKSALSLGFEFESLGIKLSGGGDIKILQAQLRRQVELIGDIQRYGRQAQNEFNALISDPRRITGTKEERDEIEKTIREALKNKSELLQRELDEGTRAMIIQRQIDLQKIKDAKDAQDKQIANYEKFINETIARARQFASQFGQSFIVPDLDESFTNTKDKIFKSAFKLLNDVKRSNLKIRVPVQLEMIAPPETALPAGQSFGQMFKTEVESFVNNAPFDFSVAAAQSVEKLREQFKQFGIDQFLKLPTGLNADQLTKLLEETLQRFNAIKSVADELSSAFAGVFSQIAQGANAFKAIGDAIKQVIVDLISATIKALIFKLIIRAFGFGGAPVQGIGGLIGGLAGAGKFARGGVVPPGYPNDSYPALLSSNEHVLTPQQMSQLIAGRGGGSDIIEVHQYTDGLLTSIARAQRRRGRNG